MTGPATGAIPSVTLPAVAGPAAALRRAGPRRLVLLAAVLVCAAVAAAAMLAGVRLFIVQSPSMGAAAPVGTLVVGVPEPAGGLRVGDLVTYRAPDSAVATYTHRVVAVVPGGYRTRGDINGTRDPWVVTRAMVVSRAAVVLPGLGWTVRGLPIVVAGLMLTGIATLPMRHPTRRAAVRLLGVAVSVAAAAAALRPFTGYQLLNAVAVDGGMRTTVVSTALLPIRLTAVGGDHLDLTTGQAGHLLLPSDTVGHVAMTSALQLDPMGWLLVGLVCALPVLWVLVVGLPLPETADAAAA